MKALPVFVGALIALLGTPLPAQELPNTATPVVFDYLGQKPPGLTPVVFAPGVVSNEGSRERSLSFSPKGDELFFTRGSGWPDNRIMHMRRQGGQWSAPEPAAFLKGARATQAVFSPDGQYLYYSSSHGQSDPRFFSLWRSRKLADGWSEPESVIDIGGGLFMEFHPSITRDGSLYFLYWDFSRQTGDLYVASLAGGKAATPVLIGSPISTPSNEVRPTVDPDGRYLLFESDRSDGLGGTDIYIAFKKEDGTWASPQNLGPTVNTADDDDTPDISPDGRYWFFSKNGDIYWKEAPAALLASLHGVPLTTSQPAQDNAGEAPDRNRPPIIPAWAFGHWVWEDTAHTRDAVEYMVSGYRAHGIPVGAVIFDSPWCTTYNDFVWNSEGYPRAQGMIDDLHARGIKVVTFYTGAINRESSDTMKQKCDSYDYVVVHDFAINGNRESRWWKGPAVHVDFTNPTAVAWWQTQVAALHSMGVDGAKIDSAHAMFGATVETSRGPMANREFGYYYFKQAFDYHTARNPEFVAMTYAWSGFGFVGWPATSHVNWVGDFRGDWQGMKDQLNAIYRSAQAGFSGLACEIGGFWQVPSTKEQFLRYAQMGCFMPIMINGGQLGSLGHHLPWRHDDETVELYRDLVLLHEALAPYLFSAGVDAHRDGSTIVRDSSIDNESHRLGPWLFVKAITSADATVRATLPVEGEWLDFWTDARHAAGAVVERAYPRDQYPVFVRAGTILPVAGRSRFFGGTDAVLPPATTFAIYPGGVSDYVFHQPTGTGTDYRDVRVAVDAAAGTLRVQADAEDLFRLLVKATQAPTGVRGADTWSYDAARRLLRIDKRGRNVEVQVGGLSPLPTESASIPPRA